MKHLQPAALHLLHKPHRSSCGVPGATLGLEAAADGHLRSCTLPLICFICFGVQRDGWGRTSPSSPPYFLGQSQPCWGVTSVCNTTRHSVPQLLFLLLPMHLQEDFPRSSNLPAAQPPLEPSSPKADAKNATEEPRVDPTDLPFFDL